MLEEALMLLGALVWLAGEILAIKTTGDTTTHYVRATFLGRFVGVSVAAWLVVHFLFGVV